MYNYEWRESLIVYFTEISHYYGDANQYSILLGLIFFLSFQTLYFKQTERQTEILSRNNTGHAQGKVRQRIMGRCQETDINSGILADVSNTVIRPYSYMNRWYGNVLAPRSYFYIEKLALYQHPDLLPI